MRANRIISTVALNPFLIDAQQILGKLLLSRKLQGLARARAEVDYPKPELSFSADYFAADLTLNIGLSGRTLLFPKR
jgi:hypothetical protein